MNKTCEFCGDELPDVERRRRNTAYADDEMNFITTCLKCFETDCEYWKYRWDEYYGNMMG